MWLLLSKKYINKFFNYFFVLFLKIDIYVYKVYVVKIFNISNTTQNWLLCFFLGQAEYYVSKHIIHCYWNTTEVGIPTLACMQRTSTRLIPNVILSCAYVTALFTGVPSTEAKILISFSSLWKYFFSKLHFNHKNMVS